MSFEAYDEDVRPNDIDPDAYHVRADEISVADAQAFEQRLVKLPAALRRMGYNGLRPGQDKVISSILCARDTLCILPTGAGKTACFALPTLAAGWRTIVLSPLISLMRDQTQNLSARGLNVAQINSSVPDSLVQSAMRDWAQGNLDLLFCAPERLRRKEFIEFMQKSPPDFVVIDEAHCASQWGDSFRASYYFIGHFVDIVKPKVVAALTATCEPEVEEDVRHILCMHKAHKVLHYVRRSNLELHSGEWLAISDLAQQINAMEGSTIVYCSTIKMVATTADQLQHMVHGGVMMYHGELGTPQRSQIQDAFMQGDVKVMVATNAFGMGVDKPDIRAVYHRNIPGTLAALQQEIGRAGRDGKPSLCVTFFDQPSVRTQQFFIENGNPSQPEITRVFTAMQSFANADGLLRVTNNDLAKRARVHPMKMAAINQVLTGNKIIERAPSHELIASVRFQVAHGDRYFRQVADLVREVAELDSGGNYKFDLRDLVNRSGATESTVRNWLKQQADKGNIDYLPPFRGSSTKILQRSLSHVNFERLADKAAKAGGKLQEVIRYCNDVPDHQKHQYLEEYFKLLHS